MSKFAMTFIAILMVGMMAIAPIVLAEEYETEVLFQDSFVDDEVDFDDNWESDNEDLYEVKSGHMKCYPFNDTSEFLVAQDNAIRTQEEFNEDVFTFTFDIAFETDNDDYNSTGMFALVDDSDDAFVMMLWNSETLYFVYDLQDEGKIIDTEVEFNDAREFKNIQFTYDREEEEILLVVSDGSKIEYEEDFTNVGELGDDYFFAFGYAFAPVDPANATFIEDSGRMYIDDVQLTIEVEVERNEYAQYVLDYWYLFTLGGIALCIVAYLVADEETDVESVLWGTGIWGVTFGMFAWLIPEMFDYYWLWITVGVGIWFGSNAIVGHYLMHDWENQKLERMFVTSLKTISIVLIIAFIYLYYYYLM